jgi:hypothetical protein
VGRLLILTQASALDTRVKPAYDAERFIKSVSPYSTMAAAMKALCRKLEEGNALDEDCYRFFGA